MSLEASSTAEASRARSGERRLRWAAAAQYTALVNSVAINLALSLIMATNAYGRYSTALSTVLFFVALTDNGVNMLAAGRGDLDPTNDLLPAKVVGAVLSVAASILLGSLVHHWPGSLTISTCAVALAVPAYTYVETKMLAELSWLAAAKLRFAMSALTFTSVVVGATAGVSLALILGLYTASHCTAAVVGARMLRTSQQAPRRTRLNARLLVAGIALAAPLNMTANGLIVISGAFDYGQAALTRVVLLAVGGLLALTPISTVHVASLARHGELGSLVELAKKATWLALILAMAAAAAAPLGYRLLYGGTGLASAGATASAAILATPLLLLSQWQVASHVGDRLRRAIAVQAVAATVAATAFVLLRDNEAVALTVAVMALGSIPLLGLQGPHEQRRRTVGGRAGVWTAGAACIAGLVLALSAG